MPDRRRDLEAGPRVGVVIPCRDEVSTLGRCLDALRRQDPPVSRVVVVDNGSTDGSLAVAHRQADVVLEVPDARIGGLRNRGAGLLGADVAVLAFVDADCEVGEGWLRAGLAALETCELVGSRTLPSPDARWVARRWATLEADQAHHASKVWTQHLLLRRATFEAVGGFDETLSTAEDIMLSVQVTARGGSTRLDPDMVAVHHGFPEDLRSFLRRERWHTSSPGWFARMSPKSQVLVLATALWSVLGAAAAGRTVLGRRTPLLGWGLGTGAAVPVLGWVGGRSLRCACQDGVLLGLWAAVRVTRLGREAAHHLRKGSS